MFEQLKKDVGTLFVGTTEQLSKDLKTLLPCDGSNGGDSYECDDCPSPCPDERAKNNIKSCYIAVFGDPYDKLDFECPSDCSNCEYGFRTREP